MSKVHFLKPDPKLIEKVESHHKEIQRISMALSGVSSMIWNAGVDTDAIAGLIEFLSDNLFQAMTDMESTVSKLNSLDD